MSRLALLPRIAGTDVILTIDLTRSIINGSTARVSRNGPVTLTVITSLGELRTGDQRNERVNAALFTSTLTLPNSAIAE